MEQTILLIFPQTGIFRGFSPYIILAERRRRGGGGGGGTAPIFLLVHNLESRVREVHGRVARTNPLVLSYFWEAYKTMRKDFQQQVNWHEIH